MYILFDIGGTKMRIAASVDGATFSAPVIISTPQRYDAGMAMLKKKISDFTKEYQIRAIAGGLPGVFDREKTKILKSPNLPLWEMKPIVEEFMSEFRVPVILENDSALGGLGEALHGAGIGRKIVAYIAIGTGIGGARIVEGRIDERSHGFEPGHQVVDYASGRDLESMISGSALEKEYKKLPSEIADPAVWNEVARVLSCGLANTIVHWSPDVVVLGGAISQFIPLEHLEHNLPKFVKVFPELPSLRKGVLGDNAGLFGALQLLKSSDLL